MTGPGGDQEAEYYIEDSRSYSPPATSYERMMKAISAASIRVVEAPIIRVVEAPMTPSDEYEWWPL